MLNSHEMEAPSTGKGRPWFTMVLLTGLFFGMLHDPLFSQNFLEPMSSADVAKKMLEGSVARKVVLIFLGIFASYILMGRDRYYLRLGNGLLGWLLISFVIWIVLSNAWADDMKLTLKRSAVFILFFMGAVGVALKFSLEDLLVLVFASTLTYLILGLMAEFALHTFQPFDPEYRFCGTLHPNHQGTNCALLLFSSVFLREKLKRFSIFFLAVAVVAFIFMGMTKSRGSFASAICALVALKSLTIPMSKKLIVLWAGCMAFCIFLMAAGDDALDYSRKGMLLGRQTDASSNTQTLSGRTRLWKACIGYATRHPILGYGWGGFWTPKLAVRISGEEGWGIALGHSAYLDVMLTLGFMGLAVFLAMLSISLTRSLFYCWVTGDPGYAFLFTVLAYGMMDSFLESAMVAQTYPLAFTTLIAMIRFAFIEPPLRQLHAVQAEA